MPGFGCLRAEGENRPSRPNHVVVTWETDTDGLPVCPVCGGVALQRTKYNTSTGETRADFELSAYCPECGERLKHGRQNNHS